MKKRFNLEIAGIGISIMSDDEADFVKNAEAQLNKSVTGILASATNLSKLDAITLAALGFSGELLRAEAKIKNLEAQIEILEANMQRLRGDAPEAVADKSVKAAPTVEKPAAKEEAPAVKQPEKAEKTEKDDSARDQKFRQLEALLGSQLKIDLDK